MLATTFGDDEYFVSPRSRPFACGGEQVPDAGLERGLDKT